jgi:peptide chain release factor
VKLLQLSAAHGPAECALAVAKALARLRVEADAAGVGVDVLEAERGEQADTWLSVLLALDGEQADALASAWAGSLLWICPSPYRPTHRRKNWFFGARLFDVPESLPDTQIRFETLRASGPGGQHVNTTASAVRAVHVASGLSVKVQTERSQHANRRLAAALLLQRLADQTTAKAERQRADRRQAHREVERGNPLRTFRGPDFTPQD